MENKTEEPIFTFESIVIQQIQSVQSGRWSMEKTIYDKLNLTTEIWTDSPITKDISHLLPSPNQILNNQLNSISNQDLAESIEPFNELAVYYAQMAIKGLNLNQQHHPLLNACHSLASTLHEGVTWNSTHLRLYSIISTLSSFKTIFNH
ncbi:unnamed protein product [Adineta steineri]|uniref:Uncharacterized protein n=2 Tax=Adineta steineri TaxID=433720 RepID=A0A819VYL4_9BILA|nr:unnamed protein product [Adineta steineri]